MVKKFLALLTVSIVIINIAHGQANLIYGIFPAIDGRILYEKTIALVGLDKKEIFLTSKQWLANEYKAQKDTAQIEDENQGLLSREGSLTVSFNQAANNMAVDWLCKHTIRINAADNEAKISVSNLELTTPSGYGTIITTTIESLKKKLDSLPASSFFGNNTRTLYWQNQLAALKKIDTAVNNIISSFDTTLKNKK